MKRIMIPVFAAGVVLGWTAGRIGPGGGGVGQPDTAVATPGSVTRQYPLHRLAADMERSRQTERLDSISRRIRAAVRTPLSPVPVTDDNSVERLPAVSEQRISGWLDACGLPAGLRSEIIAKYRMMVDAGETDPLLPGSAFDIWLAGQLDAEAAAGWVELRDAHVADVVERRANRLLTDLQRALPLEPAQKDRIYPEFVEWVRAEIAASSAREWVPDEEWLAERHGELSALIATEQQGALADWFATSLPQYWLEENVR